MTLDERSKVDLLKSLPHKVKHLVSRMVLASKVIENQPFKIITIEMH